MAGRDQRGNLLRTSFTILAALFSAGAALVSILTFAKNEGWVAGRILPANGAAGWVRLSPAADTAHALGDTLHFAATVIDTLGVMLAAPGITWTSGDTTVVRVHADGSVVAIGPGATAITAKVGKASGSARVTVAQSVAALAIEHSDGLTLGDGANVVLAARPLDARGHPVLGRRIAWRSSDTSIVAVDSNGKAAGVAPGTAQIVASVDGLSATGTVTVTPVLARLTLTAVASPAGMRSLPGKALDPIEVRALSRQGTPMSGVLLHIESRDMSGELAGAAGADSLRTGPTGAARIAWTAGDRPGRERLTVKADGLDTTLTAVLEVEPVAADTRLTLTDSVGEGRVRDSLPSPVAVRVTDSVGRPLPDVPLTWTALDGGVVTALAPRSDSTGVARARWIMGSRAGRVRLSVSAGNGRLVPPLVVSTTAIAGAPAAISIIGGEGQHGPAGHTLATAVLARVLDGDGNPVAGQRIVVTPREGEVADSAPTSDAHGTVPIRWTLGRKAGAERLKLGVQGTTIFAAVNATGVPGPAENLTFEGAPSTPTRGPVRVAAIVTDAFGNPVPKVALKAVPSGGVVTPTHVITDDAGRGSFTWTLGTTAGELRLAVRGLGVEAHGTLVVTHTAPAPPPKRHK